MTNRCLSSVMKAGYHPKDVYLFDNGSVNISDERYPGRVYPRVSLERISKNEGFTGGFNRALAWLFGPENRSGALFCTNDTIVLPGLVEACLDTAGKFRAGIVAPCITYMHHPDKIDSIGGYFDTSRAMLQHYHTGDKPYLLEEYDYIPGTALWISRKTFYRLQGVDETFYTYWEDADLSFRAFQEGIRQARAYDAMLRHAVGGTCHKKAVYTTYYFQRNRIRFCRRHLSGVNLERALNAISVDLIKMYRKWVPGVDRKRLKYWEPILRELPVETRNTLMKALT